MLHARSILVLDAHTNQALACVRSLGQAGYRVLTASHKRLPLGGWSRYSRDAFRLDAQTPIAFNQLREWAKARGVRIVLPVTERSCVLCNAARAQWEAAGMIVGCAGQEMLRTAFDKAETLRSAQACGVRIPPTRSPASMQECSTAAEEVGLPCVVKPRWSNAWDGATFLPTAAPVYVQRREDVRRAVASRTQGADLPLIQGYVEGQGKGVFTLCDRGRVVAWFAHERLRDTHPAGSGSSLRRSVGLEPRLREPAERLLAEMKWHGPAMVEFRDDRTNPPCLMEVNGRFWGSLQLGIDAGVDFPRLWVSILEGERIASPPCYVEGLPVRWLWGDVKRFIRIVGGAPQGYPGAYPTIGEGIRELFGRQPQGTRLEVWRAGDPLPAVGEWVQGTMELWSRG